VPYEATAEADIPRVAPDVVVEVISPGDRERDIEEKIRVYLAAGTMVVFLVEPKNRTVTAREPDASRRYIDGEELRHPALPDFTMPVSILFDEPKPKAKPALG
jgi:Uma2 family endonuclease